MKAWLCIFLVAPALVASAATVDYERQVFPVLKDNCIPCHNKTTTKGGLNMETPELMAKGGDTDAGLEAGKGAGSLIHLAAAHKWDSEMPPKGNKVGAVNLTNAQLDLLKRWIDEGAVHKDKKERVINWEPLPAGLKAIYAVSLTPDGHFAAAARGNQVSIYHLPTLDLVTKLTDKSLLKSGLYRQPGVAHRDIVPAIAFSPDGLRLATGSYREVKIWKRVLNGEIPAPTEVSSKFSLEAGPNPEALQLIDPSTGEKLRDIKHGAPITAFALSPDAQRFATAGEDHRIQVWETATGKPLLQIAGTLAAEADMAAKSRAEAAGILEISWLNESIKTSEKEVSDLEARLKKAQQLADTAQKDADPKRKDMLAKDEAKAAADREVKMLSDQLVALPKDKRDESLEKQLADAQAGAEKAAADAKTAQQSLQRVEATFADGVKEIEFLSKSIGQMKKKVADYKAEAAKAKLALEAATAGKTAAIEARAAAMPVLATLAFSTDGKRLLGSADGQTTFEWSATTGNALEVGAAEAVWKLERTLGGGHDPSPISDRVTSLVFSPDGSTLAVGSGEPSRSGDVTLWNTVSGKLAKTFAELHLDSVLSLAFSPDASRLASGGADKAVRVLNLKTGKVEKVFEGHTHHVLGLGWRSDGRVLSSAGADNVVKVWDWTLGERRKNIDGWDKEVTALCYVGAADLFATASGDAKVRLLNSDGVEVKQLAGVTGFMNALAVSYDGELLVAGGQDGVLRVWQVPSGKELESFE